MPGTDRQWPASGRRNISDDQRAVLANEVREMKSAIAAKEGKRKGGKAGGRGRPKKKDSCVSIQRTAKSVAKAAKLPERKLRLAQEVKKADPQENSRPGFLLPAGELGFDFSGAGLEIVEPLAEGFQGWVLEEGAAVASAQAGDFVLHGDNLLADAGEAEMEGAAAAGRGEPIGHAGGSV